MNNKLAEKLKILIITYTLEVGGAERVAVSIAKGLNKSKFEPIFCCFKGGALEKDLRDHGISVFNLNKSRGFDLSVLTKLIKIIKEKKIDIIHTHSFSPNFWGRLAGIIARVPVIIGTEHSVASVKTIFQKKADKILAKYSSKIVSVSDRVKLSLCEEENISPDKILTIYNGIDPMKPSSNKEAISKKNEGLGIDLNKKIIVSIGRLEPPKGYEFLLESAKTVKREFPPIQFVIVGEGSLRYKLEKLRDDLKLRDTVIFLGHRNDIADILSISDIAALPSVREGFSVSLLEFMSLGKPIIATDVGGNNEAVINGESGIIIPPMDPIALTQGILKLIQENNTAEDMGMRAMERFKENFTLQTMIQEIEKLYDTLFYLETYSDSKQMQRV